MHSSVERKNRNRRRDKMEAMLQTRREELKRIREEDEQFHTVAQGSSPSRRTHTNPFRACTPPPPPSVGDPFTRNPQPLLTFLRAPPQASREADVTVSTRFRDRQYYGGCYYKPPTVQRLDRQLTALFLEYTGRKPGDTIPITCSVTDEELATFLAGTQFAEEAFV